MGRVFAQELGVCGNALDGHVPDLELSWLRDMQHELRPVWADAGRRGHVVAHGFGARSPLRAGR
jgi:hypothetical protein